MDRLDECRFRGNTRGQRHIWLIDIAGYAYLYIWSRLFLDNLSTPCKKENVSDLAPPDGRKLAQVPDPVSHSRLSFFGGGRGGLDYKWSSYQAASKACML